METLSKDFLGKLSYSLVFMVLLPLGLITWANSASHVVMLPAILSPFWGTVLSAIGVLLMATGMYALWQYGDGLPMNGYPPPKFVQDGAFKLLPHPIYTGFVLLCLGVSLYKGNAVGFWLISPIALLGCMALVWGYERIDLLKRFPDARRNYWIAIPAASEKSPTRANYLSVYLLLFLPWVLLQAASTLAFPSTLYQDIQLSFLPILPESWRWGIALVAGLWVLAAPFFAQTQGQLRQFFISAMLGGGAVVYLSLLCPQIGLGHRANLELDFWGLQLLSISWFWVVLATQVYYPTQDKLPIPVLLFLSLLVAGLMLASLNPLDHMLSGGIGWIFAQYHESIWNFLRRSAEKVANSWQEWHFGPVRVINHGFYVGFGAFFGTVVGSVLAGEDYAFGILTVGVFLTVCAGLWGQFIEGSDKLKRPFGWYGSMVGVFLAILVIRWMGLDVWLMLGAFAAFMPWVQAIGRLRCLVNGCCHGAPSNEHLGIHYVHPRSRVCFISGLKGQALHPTQLYAIIWLVLVGGVQFRLWFSGVPLSLLVGLYLMLNGLGRFVEEAYRGEPQTPVFARLRLYQWAAIASLLIGMFVTVFATTTAPMPTVLTGKMLTAGLINWAIVQFLMGIDFPKSNLRFSRLT